MERMRRRAGSFVPNDPSVYGQNLTRLIHEKKLQKIKLADDAGIARSNFYRYMSGECYPSMKNMIKIADAMRVPLADFFVDNNRILPTTDKRAQRILTLFSRLTELGKDRLVHAAEWESSWLKKGR